MDIPENVQMELSKWKFSYTVLFVYRLWETILGIPSGRCILPADRAIVTVSEAVAGASYTMQASTGVGNSFHGGNVSSSNPQDTLSSAVLVSPSHYVISGGDNDTLYLTSPTHSSPSGNYPDTPLPYSATDQAMKNAKEPLQAYHGVQGLNDRSFGFHAAESDSEDPNDFDTSNFTAANEWASAELCQSTLSSYPEARASSTVETTKLPALDQPPCLPSQSPISPSCQPSNSTPQLLSGIHTAQTKRKSPSRQQKQCTICQGIFSSSSSLGKHIRTHHQGKGIDNRCTHAQCIHEGDGFYPCQKRYRDLDSLRTHWRRDHDSCRTCEPSSTYKKRKTD